jgi:hypothetical protein
MADIIANNNPNNTWGKSVVEIVLKQWQYEKTFTLHVGGNCRGFDVLDAAVGMIYDHILDTEDDAAVTLIRADGETLLCEDDEERGDGWIKDMVASVRIVDYIQPTLNEVRRINGAKPLPDGDKPYEPMGSHP